MIFSLNEKKPTILLHKLKRLIEELVYWNKS